jgi:hypothetical protein
MSENDNFRVRPSIFLAIASAILEYAIVLLVIFFSIFIVNEISHADYSILLSFISEETIIFYFTLSLVVVFFLVLFLKIIDLLNLDVIFMKEGFEYYSGLFIKNKKQFFYSNLSRINYKHGILGGEVKIELTGTELVNISIPYVTYPGATAAKIKKIVDDSLAANLSDKLKFADKSLQEDTISSVVEMMRKKEITKENVAEEIENATKGEKLSKNVYAIILEYLIKRGRLSKADLSMVMFSLFEKSLITKKDIADVIFYLNDMG